MNRPDAPTIEAAIAARSTPWPWARELRDGRHQARALLLVPGMTASRTLTAAMFAISLGFGTLGGVAPAFADDSSARPVTPPRQAGARLVPLRKDKQLVGFKVYAITTGSRYSTAKLLNGDIIEKIDGAAVTAEADAAKVTDAKTSVTVTVRRTGTTVLELVIAAP